MKMQLKKNLVFVVSVILLICSIPLFAGSQVNNYDDYQFSRLAKIAAEKGYVRVIVEFDVPGIDALRAISNSYRTGDQYKGFFQSAVNADQALGHAISMSRDTVLHQLNGCNYEVTRSFSTLPGVGLIVAADALEKLRSIPEIVRVTEDKPTPLPGDEFAETSEEGLSSPKLDRTTEIVGATAAWGFGYTGAGWYVAILDSGLLTSHQMFSNKNIVEACFSWGADYFDEVNGGCPNGLKEMYGPGSAAHQVYGGDHGSHVTGIAAGNDQDSHFGVAKGADIIAIQVFTYFPFEGDILSWNTDQLAGLEYVYTLRNAYNIASANLSLGSANGYSSYCDDALLAQAISNLKAVGIATAVASGNEGRCGAVANPACISSAVTVDGTDKNDNVYGSGNWHDVIVDLLAPAVSVNSARAYSNESYGTATGTSMAAPHVAGAWAIMRQYDPSMSVDEILAVLQDTGQMLNTDYCASNTAKARFNVADALMSLFIIAPPINIAAVQETNKSFLQTEYINVLTWESNPYNADNNVAHYRVYVVGSGNQLTRLGEVDSSTFTFWHRKVNKREEMTYAVTAVDASGLESPPFHYTLDFGVTQ